MSRHPYTTSLPVAILESKIQHWIRETGNSNICIQISRISSTVPIFDDEEVFIANAVNSRRAEFAAGRYCARKAMNQLGINDISIHRGDRGEPLWPEHIVGSISHDHGLAIAVVAPLIKVGELGIDLLSLEHQIDSSISNIIANHNEVNSITAMLEHHPIQDNGKIRINPVLLIFSAKESAIKAVSPSLDFYLDFKDIELVLGDNYILANFSNLDRSVKIYWQVFENILVTISYSLFEN